MAELLQANWILVVIALVIGVLVAWWIFVANRKTRVEIERREEADTAARRNQALIDAPPAAGGLSSAANTQDVAAAPLGTDAEAGPAPEPVTAPSAAAPAPPPMPEAVPEAAPVSSPSAAGSGDDLTRIKGLGPKLRTQLGELGITTFAQIAAWDEAEIDRVDAQLGRFQGRIRRDSWVEQAKLLAAGDQAGFEERFGRT